MTETSPFRAIFVTLADSDMWFRLDVALWGSEDTDAEEQYGDLDQHHDRPEAVTGDAAK